MRFFANPLFQARITDRDRTIIPAVARDVTAYISDAVRHIEANTIYYKLTSFRGRSEILLQDWTLIVDSDTAPIEEDLFFNALHTYTFEIIVPIDTTGSVRIDFKVVDIEGEEYQINYEELTID